MNIQDLLEAEMNKLRRLNPEVHALLETIFQYKDGKGDYSVDRHRWMETLDEETFLNEIHQIETREKAIAIAHAQITQQIAKETLASTVTLEMKDATGRLLGIGGGFFIQGNQIVTSFHVIEGARRGAVKLLGKSTTYNIEGITAKDEKHDLVILQVPNFGIPPLPLDNSDTVGIGEIVYVPGNPKESTEAFSYGIISSIRGSSTDRQLQMTAMPPPWSSGIPVLNEKGEVIGISVMTVADEQNPNFIIPANYLKTLLTRTEPARPLSQGEPLVSAGAYFRWGYTKSELGQYESAIADYDMAIQLRSDYAIAYNDRGVVKGKLSEYKEAIKDYDEAIRIKPDCVVAYYNRGRTKDQLEQSSAAIDDYNIAIDLEPTYADAYYNRGVVKGKLGEYDAAIADYDEAICLKPDYAMAYYNRGNARTNLGRVPEAAQDFQIALALAEQTGDQGLKAMISSPMEIHVG